MTAIRVVLLVCIATSAVGIREAWAQPAAASREASGEWWWLADKLYYEPLMAEQRAARILLVFPGWSKEFPHSVLPGDRFAWQVTMGREIPIVGYQRERIGLARFAPGKWGVGFWVPISFHVIEDFKDDSNPIVDTDYRFGMMVKAQVGLPGRAWLSVRFVPWAHESTHLGDEYTIFAQRRLDFERVNVSYEYHEYGVSYEKSFGRNSLLTIRHGGISLWGSDGYYSNHLLGTDAATLSPTEKNYEPSFGAEFRFPKRVGVIGSQGRQLVASVDFRHRLQYSFHHPASGDERRRPTWTIAVGRAVLEGDRRFLRSYFGYFTHGVNPYGQLREQYPFWAAGIGWVFQ